MDDQMNTLVSGYSLGADCPDHSVDLAFHCSDPRNNDSMQRFLHSDHPSFFANSQSWSPAMDHTWSKQGCQRPQLENPWQRPPEYPAPPWNSPRHEEMTLDRESTSSGSVWSPCTNETYPDHEAAAHRPSLTPDVFRHNLSQNVEANSSFSGDLHYEGPTPFVYVVPSAICQHPEAEANAMDEMDDDAEGESEDFSADHAFQEETKAPCYGAQTGYTVSKLAPILSISEEERNRFSGNGVSVKSANGEDEEMELEGEPRDDDGGSDYKPSKRIKPSHARRSSRPSKPIKAFGSQYSTRRASNPLPRPAHIAKQPSSNNPTVQPNASSPTLLAHQKPCSFCPQTCPSNSSLHKHILTAHTRPFICVFARYGCPATFGSKNEYKRHVSSQHVRPGVYRCDIGSCIPQPRTPRQKSSSASSFTSEGAAQGYNEFNRKDLFTQHVRRMHGPSNSAAKEAFEARLEEIRQRCWIKLHDAPPRSVCGFCRRTPLAPGEDGGKEVVFEGKKGWEDRMEHVARHLEKGHLAEEEEEDEGLREWMVEEGLMQWSAKEGTWRVVGLPRKKGEREEDAEGEVE